MFDSVILFVSDYFEPVVDIFTGVVTIASAACAFIPGQSWFKGILNTLALNVKNAKPEKIQAAKNVVDSIADSIKTEKK